MFGLDTKFGNINLTAFGDSLEKVFGKSAAEFKSELDKCSHTVKEKFKSIAEDYFTGLSILLDSKISSRLERKLSRRRKSEISESINDFTLTCAVTTTLYDLLNKLQAEENGQL